jgi:hypothetical protein
MVYQATRQQVEQYRIRRQQERDLFLTSRYGEEQLGIRRQEERDMYLASR